MLFKVVAIPIYEIDCRSDCERCHNNSMGGQGAMAKYDPKLIKKISHSKLIACATEIGVKNADKVSKELLIPAYLDAVEKVDAEGGTNSANVVNMYNEIVTTLKLDQDEEAATEKPEASVPEEASPDTPAKPAPQMSRRPAAAPAPAPNKPKAAAPAPPKDPKEKKAPSPPAPKSYNRWTTLGDAVVQMKKGKLSDLIILSNKIYADLGGKDNVKEAGAVGKGGITLMDRVGAITITGDTFTSDK